MPSALGMLVLVTALVMPVSVRAACSPTHSSARLTSTVRSLVDRMNARGLRHLARSGNSGARGNWSGSPVLDWYFDTIESGRALADQPDGARNFLAALNFAGINLSGEMWAEPVGSKYSAADATVLARNYCVRTRWEKLAANRRISLQWGKTHVPQLPYLLEIDGKPGILFIAGLTAVLPRIPTQFLGKLPFYARDGVRGARVDDGTTKTLLYLFWGHRDPLIRFRQALDLDRWKEILKDFHPTWVFLSNVAYEHSYEFSRLAPGGAFFGATAMPQYPYQQGVAGSGYTQLGAHNAMVEVGEGIAGTLKLNCIPMKPKGRICPGVDWITYNTLPAKKYRFSAVVPMLYVVVERQTGAILLMGAHE